MAKNSTTLQDEDGDFSDWVEIYNSSTSAVDLNGYGLSDDEAEPYKWVFPTTVLQPNEFLLVFCSDKDRNSGPIYHTNFKLSGSDEIALTNNLGSLLDEKELTTSVHDISEGYVVDGVGSMAEFYESTPGASNLNGRLHNSLTSTHESGFYTSSFNLNIAGSEPHEIRFTTNGSEPTLSNPIWSGSVEVVNRSSETNSISTIPTNASNLSENIIWEEPSSNVFKGTVFRFRSFESGMPTSHTLSQSFFVHQFGAYRYSLAVVSIITDSLSLFDYDSGIYVPGATHDANPNGGGVWGTGNYKLSGDEWERRAHIQLFDDDGALELAQDVGIRIHGSGSSSMPQKSLRIYAREKYGEKDINHQVFQGVETDQFDVLLLRNMGQDFRSGVAQDVLAHKLISGMHQAKLGFRPVIVFINGEYWGIQNIRERFDKHFLAQFHELDKDSIDIIGSYYGGFSVGDNEAFFELYDFMDANVLSAQSNYDFAASKMDIEDFMDNTLTRIYLGCYDWPGNNMKMWRPREVTGKFKWLLLDNDGCLGNYSHNSIEHATEPNNPGWPNPPESTLFLRKLLENDGFKQQFIGRMVELLNTVFDKDAAGTKLTELYDYYAPEYEEHDERWLMLEGSQTLQENYENIMNVIRLRPCYVRQHFIDHFNLAESEFPFECDSSALYLGLNNTDITGGMSIYPNPNSGNFKVRVQDVNSGNLVVQIYDLTGRQVYYETDIEEKSGEIEVSANRLASGIYTLSVKSGTQTFTKKLALQPN